MSTPQMGRQDQTAPWLTARAKSNLTMALIGAWALIAWHVAVAACTPVSLSQPSVTWDAALEQLSPIAALPGDTSAGVLLGVWAAIVFVGAACLLVPLAYLRGRWQRRRAGKGMAGSHEVRDKLGLQRARQRAQHDQPSMADGSWKKAEADAVGLTIGTEVTSGEKVVVPAGVLMSVLGPTGALKTNGLVIPACLSAPGALVVTTNETGLLDVIGATRARKGRVWVFDPLERSAWPEPMTWDPISGAGDPHRALARAEGFADGCLVGNDGGNTKFFRDTATAALRACFHAAAISSQRVEGVLGWAMRLDRGGADEPASIIKQSDDPEVATLWANRLEDVATGADDTTASTRTTLGNIIDPLLMPSVLRWVTPREGVPNFDADAFVRSTDTLVLISDSSSATNVSPLCTMLFQEVVDAIKRAAPFLPGRTFDPFIRIVGEEIANVAPLHKLPDLCTELRKLGVQVVVVFQSSSQLVVRWGQHKAKVLLDNMGAEMVLAGLKDTDGLNRYSDLAGITEVLGASMNVDANGVRTGSGFDLRERKALRPEEIRMIPDGHALLVFSNVKPMMIKLSPWFAAKNADQLSTDQQTSLEARTRHHQEQVTARATRAAAAREQAS